MRNTKKGKFIVIEGIDGCGGETQTRKLVQHLRKNKMPVKSLSYPDYKGPIGRLIDAYLHRRHNFSKEVQFLLYFSDFLKDKDKINKWLEEGITIIADRYFSSTIAYQCLGGFSVDRAVKVSRLFDLPRPDKIILLDIASKTSMERKGKEKGGALDRNEADKKFLTGLAKFYKQLARKKVFADWAVVGGEQSIEEVFTEIKKLI